MKEKDSVENNEKSPDNRKKSGEKIISDNKTISANGKAFAGESRENKMGVMSEGKLLMTAPSIWVIILYIVRPVDCSNLSNVIWKAIPKAQQQHTSRYSVPYWITRASPV